MRSRLLVRHFLSQFVENDLAPDADRHQLLALVAAGIITLPLFTSVIMSVQYLLQALQTPAWTQVTATTDRMIFCAMSMLVSAIVATLEWDALALSARDAAILGVLPISHPEIVRAKVVSLVTFSAGFIAALNALPTVIHPTVMVANLPLHLLTLAPLIAIRGFSMMAAGAFGFGAVVVVRECLNLFVGRRAFKQVSDFVRSALLFSLLLLLLLAPSRLSGRNDWIFEGTGGPILQRPVAWFVAMDTVMTGRLLDDLPRPDMNTWEIERDDRLVARYRQGLPHLAARANRGAGVLLVVLALAAALYLWNAKRLHLRPTEGSGAAALLPVPGVTDILARIMARRPATRAGLVFLGRAVRGSPAHRLYLTAAVAIGAALMLGMAPAAGASPSAPVHPFQLAAQTLLLTALVAGFRAAIRTSADPRAAWLFEVADTGTIAAFREGVRRGVLAAVMGTVLALWPLHAAVWGARVASMHAVNGAALGWLLVEIACGDVAQPLVRTIPSSDALNTVGAVFLGAIVICVFVLAGFETLALTRPVASVLFPAVMLLLALWVHRLHEGDHRASAGLPSDW